MRLLDSVRYYWRSSLAVILAAAVTTAVLGGALIVGDSVRGSLIGITLERLGGIDQALVSEQFFRQELASELMASEGFSDRFAVASPAILLRGSVRHAENERRASQVSVQGVDDSFQTLFPEQAGQLDLSRDEGQPFPSIVINTTLAQELAAQVGDGVILSLERPSDIPRDSLMGSADPTDAIQTLRLTVKAILPDEGAGIFGLAPHQTAPLVGFTQLRDLARGLRQRGRANAIFVSSQPEFRQAIEARDEAVAETQREALHRLLGATVKSEDLGLEIETLAEEPSQGAVQISSRELIVRPALEETLGELAQEEGISRLEVTTYLANRAYKVDDSSGQPVAVEPGRLTPYSTVTAIGRPTDTSTSSAETYSQLGFGELKLTDGRPAPLLGPSEIHIQEWVADDLALEVGDRMALDYYEVGEREELITRTAVYTVRGILAMSGLAIDQSLTPEFPGVNDADNMADWDPTFPVDLDLIRDKDEEYWDEHRSAPKYFISLDEAKERFSSRFGELSSLRLLEPSDDQGSVDIAQSTGLADRLKAKLPRRSRLLDAGLAVQPLKAQGLTASSGATDFGGLFIGFSMFLIVSSALLVALFFRLGVERRVKELGLRLAMGTTVKGVRRAFLKEGMLLAVVGGLLGLLGAVAYAALMLKALSTLWIEAVGASFLELHIAPQTLPLAFLLSMLVVLFAIWRAVKRLAGLPVIRLLRGSARDESVEGGRRTSRWSKSIAIGSFLLAAVLLVISMRLDPSQAPAAFFGVGAAVLVFGLSLFALWLAARRLEDEGADDVKVLTSAPRMALANAEVSAGRTLLSVALVAAASFVIVAVGSYGLRFGEELRELHSGAGGYPLIARADVPVHHDLADEDGRFELGFSDSDSEQLADASVVHLATVPGDDVSCLNLFQPETPGLLGVPTALTSRNGFSFTRYDQDLLEGLEPDAAAESNPWLLLQATLPDVDGVPVIPAFGDNNSVLWILKSNLGRDVEMTNEAGDPIRLRLVGLLKKSIFQSDLLIAQNALLEHFPSRGGAQVFLIDTPVGEEEASTRVLEKGLERFGFDVQPTAQLLQAYQAVENTYLSTFQTLGGLGLLLGTLGLAVILLRNVIERRSELTTMRALGFRRRRLGWLVLLENLVALISGIVIGTVAALVAVAPHLREASASVPWLSLTGTLMLVIAVGALASVFAVRAALRTPLLPSLRAE